MDHVSHTHRSHMVYYLGSIIIIYVKVLRSKYFKHPVLKHLE
jgi:hypothetical protein